MNLYIVALAGTSVGKNRPLSAVAEILRAAKLEQLQTTAKGFSVSAIEQMVVEHPCCVATVDEIGANLLSRMSHKTSNTHEMAMRGALLELWSRYKGMAPFATHRRAQSQSVEVPSPSLSLFGVSTPEAFYSALTSGSVKDGFLNRFLLAQAAPRARGRDVPEEAMTPPPELLQALWALIPQASGNIGEALGVFAVNSSFDGHRLEWDSTTTASAADDFEERVLSIIDGDPDNAPFLGRVYEQSVRLAGLHAVAREGRFAKVSTRDLEWGAAWALSSAQAMIDGATNMMATTDYETKFNAIRNAIREAGQITKQELSRKVRSVKASEREDVIKHLKEGGWIKDDSIPTPGRHAAGYTWLG